MFGIPLEIISMLLSTILGGFMKMKAMQQQDNAERDKLMLARLKATDKSRDRARAMQTPNANWARKFIVICLMIMAGFILIAPMLFNAPTNVLSEDIHGFKIWFLDFTWAEPVWVQLQGVVTPEWLPYAILNVLGFYFGTGAVNRRM
jgi:hypothetical protein